MFDYTIQISDFLSDLLFFSRSGQTALNLSIRQYAHRTLKWQELANRIFDLRFSPGKHCKFLLPRAKDETLFFKIVFFPWHWSIKGQCNKICPSPILCFSDYQTENVLSIDYVSRRYANIEHHGVIYLICLISAVFYYRGARLRGVLDTASEFDVD